jgi:hypothetical protein
MKRCWLCKKRIWWWQDGSAAITPFHQRCHWIHCVDVYKNETDPQTLKFIVKELRELRRLYKIDAAILTPQPAFATSSGNFIAPDITELDYHDLVEKSLERM